MTPIKQTVLYGFTLFAMFFGSGNLVFPLQVGQITTNNWLIGFFGLFITGIILPFLGLFVIKLFHGNYNAFFGQAGPLAQKILPLFTLSLLGSFGVVPRCITVAYAGIHQLLPDTSLILFSLIFSVACYVICLKDRTVVRIIGTWMSPILVLSLIWMIFAGVLHAPSIGASHIVAYDAFTKGFLIGYQIMDLFAAFFFSAFIFLQIQKNLPTNICAKDAVRAAIAPSIFGISLLAAIYMGLVFLGAHYASIIAHVSPEQILPIIASYAIGTGGALLIAIAVGFSCLTTAVALNNIYARYICEQLKLDAHMFPLILLATTGISFCISLLDFKGIAAFLAPALELTYPSIILLTVLCIFTKGHRVLKQVTFYAILGLMLYIKFGK